MAEIVNLRRVKKTRARAAAAQDAVESRVRHGRNGAEKARDRLAQERQRAALDGARRPGEPEPA
jgi:hypothetical protein